MTDPQDPSDDQGQPEGSPPRVERDRAAILARRQHFIALALSGLASTVACDAKPGQGDTNNGNSGRQSTPDPCLKVAVPDPEQDDGQGDEDPSTGPPPPDPPPPDPPPPQVCLKFAPPPDDDPPPKVIPPPQPCLKIAPPSDDPPPKVTPPPQPCLKQAAPRPCLRKKAPDPNPNDGEL